MFQLVLYIVIKFQLIILSLPILLEFDCEWCFQENISIRADLTHVN